MKAFGNRVIFFVGKVARTTLQLVHLERGKELKMFTLVTKNPEKVKFSKFRSYRRTNFESNLIKFACFIVRSANKPGA